MLLSITLQRYKLKLNLQNKIGIIFNFIYKKNPSRPWPMVIGRWVGGIGGHYVGQGEPLYGKGIVAKRCSGLVTIYALYPISALLGF